MLTFFIIFIFSLLAYLLLTLGSGDVFLWSREEIILGLLFSVLTALALKLLFNLLGIKLNSKFLNPWRGFLFFIYIIGPFLLSLTKANFDVVWRIITGKINPGIVEISPKLKTDFGTTLLANSITLTPGTLTVDVDERNNLYVHCLYVHPVKSAKGGAKQFNRVKEKSPSIEHVCSKSPWWIKKITE